MNPRLLRPLASGAFNPKQISGLSGWWDADDASTVSLSGSLATAWADKSGNGNHLPAASGSEPEYESTSLAGRGGMNFGSTQGTAKGFLLNPPTTAITGRDVFVVCDWNAGATSTEYASIFALTFVLGLNNTGTSFYNVGVSRFSINGAASSLTALPAIQAANVLRGTFSSPATGSAISVGRWGGFTTRNFPGRIHEVILYDRELSDAEAARVRQYLNSKWKIDAPPAYADDDVNAYITAVEAADGLTLDEAVRDAYNDFIVGCKSDGIWDAIKASCILAGARTLAGALVPLKGAAPTNNNFAEADYNRETGLVGDGSTTHLDSNRAGDDDPLNDKHVAVFVSEAETANGFRYYFGTSFPDDFQAYHNNLGSVIVAANGNNTSTSGVTPSDIAGSLFGLNRASAASFTLRANGTNAVYSNASDAAKRTSTSQYIFSHSTFNQATSSRLAFYSIGESLDLAALDTRVSALITAIGNAI